MKLQILLPAFIWLLASLQADAQQKAKLIAPYRLSVSTDKTTIILFPFAIKSIDRGSKDVLVQRLQGAENILQVKAAVAGFNETNLSVVTADGKFYSFILDYAVVPNMLNMSFLGDTDQNIHAFIKSEDNAGKLWEDCSAIDTQRRHIIAKHHSAGAHLQLTGIFVHDDVLYFRLNIHNSAQINYPVDLIRFSIVDEKRGKRYAIQSLDKVPAYIYNATEEIKAGAQVSMIYAIPSFTIPDKKYLQIEVMEKNGGRHLHLAIKGQKLLKAKPVQHISEQ